MAYVIRTSYPIISATGEPDYAVGYYKPDGEWVEDSCHRHDSAQSIASCRERIGR